MDVDLFDYDLPDEFIAQKPLPERSESRMLVMPREGRLQLQDRQFSELPEFLNASDVVVLNDTRVIPARLRGRRPTGGKAEVLLLTELHEDVWEALVRPGAKLGVGDRVLFADGRMEAEIVQRRQRGLRVVRLHYNNGDHDDLAGLLDEVGETPLPPYIRRDSPTDRDRARYQTVYAKQRGAAAAPTAGLHFDDNMLKRVRNTVSEVVYITLHVGLGTFEPVREDTVEDHEMHAEWCRVDEEAAEAINRNSEAGGRIIAVGTTVVRTLESRANEDGTVTAGSGLTELFIYPGYRFRVIDGLLTNFHLPQSTLLMMVSAYAGRQRILRAYRHAGDNDYRFYSYGDCMLIV